MKKVFLSLCALMATVAFSQKKWSVEVKTGANVVSGTSISSGYFPNADFPDIDFLPDTESISFANMNKSGFLTGVLGTYFISDKIGIKSGLFYDRRGYKTNVYIKALRLKYPAEQLSATIEEEVKVNSLTFPLYAQYETGGKIIKGFLYAGPYLSVPLETKVSYLGKAKTAKEKANVEFGAGFGAGFIVPINHTFDIITDAGVKMGISKSISTKNRLQKDHMEKGHLYDAAVTVGLRYHF